MSEHQGRHRLRVLGRASLQGPDGRKLTSIVKQSKRFAVLTYLAVSPGPFQRRDTLLGLFWPELDQRRARHALNQTLHYLRRSLGREVLPSRGADEVGVDPERLWCDAVELERAREEGRHADAVAIYGGVLLPGLYISEAEEFERWIEGERERCARLYAESVEALACQTEEEGKPREAVRWWRLRAEHDPYDSRVALFLMRALEASGNRAGALEHARVHLELLREEFGAEPDPDIVEFTERLKRRPRGRNGDVARGRRPVEADETRGIPSPPPSPAAPIGIRRRALRVAAVSVVATLLAAWFVTCPGDHPVPSLESRLVLAVPFENRSGDPALDPVGRMASDWITQTLAGTGIVQVVPTTTSLRALRELYPDSAGSPSAYGLELAQATGAGILVTGNYFVVSDSLVFQVEIVNAVGGELLQAIPRIGGAAAEPPLAIEALQKRVAGALAARVDPRLAKWSRHASDPPTFDAYMAYARGLDLFFRRDYATAAESLRVAATSDSTFHAPLVWAIYAYHNSYQTARSDSMLALLASRADHLSPWERAFLEMFQAHERNDLLGAFKAAEKVVEIAPGSEWTYVLANHALMINRPDVALEVVESVDPQTGWLRTWPSFWAIWRQALHGLGRHEEELDLIEEARRHHAYDNFLIDELDALGALGRGAKIREIVEERNAEGKVWLLRIAADEARAHGHEALARSLAGDALAAFGEVPPERAFMEHNRWRYGEILGLLGRWEEARASAESMMRDFPDSAGMMSFAAQAGVAAAFAGDSAYARAMASRIPELVLPDDEAPFVAAHRNDAAYFLAQIAGALGERERAIVLLRESLRLGREFTGGQASHDVAFSSLRGDPEFEALMNPRGDLASARMLVR